MAKVEAPAPVVPVAEGGYQWKPSPVFEIADETPLTRGRLAAPGLYDSNVADAVEGKAYGINVADTAEATKVLNELRKAAKHTGRKLRTWNKSDETPGYVAWKVVPTPVKADPSPAANPFPAVETPPAA
jgi:hypothetical protein